MRGRLSPSVCARWILKHYFQCVLGGVIIPDCVLVPTVSWLCILAVYPGCVYPGCVFWLCILAAYILDVYILMVFILAVYPGCVSSVLHSVSILEWLVIVPCFPFLERCAFRDRLGRRVVDSLLLSCSHTRLCSVLVRITRPRCDDFCALFIHPVLYIWLWDLQRTQELPGKYRFEWTIPILLNECVYEWTYNKLSVVKLGVFVVV